MSKSFIALRKFLSLSAINAPCNGLIVSTDYGAQTDVLIPDFHNLLEEVGIPFEYKSQQHRIILPWCSILFKTANKRIQGFEVGYAYIDEAAYCPDQAWTDVLARTSDKRTKQRQILCTSTPEGRSGFFYDNFDKNPLQNSKLIQGTVYDNAPNLHIDYIKGLEGAYSEKLKNAYLYGRPTDFSHDNLYPSFSQDKHISDSWMINTTYGKRDISEGQHEKIYIACDFGNAVGAWSIIQVMTHGEKEYVYVLDEIHQESTNTFDMANEFVKRFKGKWGRVEVQGDASGQFLRSTTSSVSDYDVIQKTLEPHFKVDISTPSRSPRIIDRINNLESALRGGPHFEMKINPRCMHLIEDLINVRYMDDGSRRPDKKHAGGKYTHHTDALGYFLMDRRTPLQEFKREAPYQVPDGMPSQYVHRA